MVRLSFLKERARGGRRERMKAAVIGIGSNSVRMLIARIGNGRMERLARDREGTRLFAGLDENGNLTEASMRKTADAVCRMARRARAEGCERLKIFATSASRDARNGEMFLEMLRTGTGVEPEIITGEEEAVLSFRGATELLPGDWRKGMIDIGGGSTELVIGRDREIEFAVSCQMGAVRLFRQVPIEKETDLARVVRTAGEILDGRWREGIEMPREWVGTGGTFTVLAAIVNDKAWNDRSCTHGTRISREAAENIARRLAGMTMAERLRLPCLQPQRADIVVHGICILLAVMDRLGIGEVRVSEFGNLDGYLKKMAEE